MFKKNKIKLISFCVLLTFTAYSNATTKDQLLGSMSGSSQSSDADQSQSNTQNAPTSSASGGLVNNNVNYGGSNNSQVSSATISQLAQANYLNSGARNVSQPTKQKQVKKTYKKKKAVAKKTNTTSVENQKIDISYFGDVSGVPNLISQYFSGMSVSAPLGKVTNQQVSFDMQQVSIEEISSMINSLTTGSSKLIYNPNNNTIRVYYLSSASSNQTITGNINSSTSSQSENWRNGKGKPRPIMTDSGVLLFPYGQYEPTVICKPQQICDIQFEAGENIIDAVMGDTSRWVVKGVVSGVGKNSVKHIVLKPQYPELSTNMIVTTDKGRTYNLKLVSSEKNYISAVSWYYPQDMSTKLMGDLSSNQSSLNQSNDSPYSSNSNAGVINQGLTSTANGTQVKGIQTDDDSMPLLDLDFRYKISGDKKVWKPVRVFNDSVHTFIEVNPKALNTSSPVFMVLDQKSGNYEMVNYRQKGNYYIVDQIFEVGVFIQDVGSNNQKVTIEHIEDTSKDNKNWLY